MRCRGKWADHWLPVHSSHSPGRGALTRISVPVLLINGDRDRYFPKDLIEETARLIPDCTLVWLHGKGHDGVCRSPRLAQITLDHINRRSACTGTA